MQELHRSNSTQTEETNERNKRKAICQITLNEENVGCGCLIYDPRVENQKLSKYCIITSSKVISDENLADNEYHVFFERESGSRRDILLSDIVMKTESEACIFSGSGVVLIFINSGSQQLCHGCGPFHVKCSVLKLLPKIASPHKESEKFCYINSERYECVEDNGVYSLKAPGDGGSIPQNYTSVVLECVGRKEINAVGIITSEKGDISTTWLKSSLEEMLGEFDS